MNIRETVRDTLAEALGQDKNNVDWSKDMVSLGLDSLDFVEIAMSLEEDFELDEVKLTATDTLDTIVAQLETTHA